MARRSRRACWASSSPGPAQINQRAFYDGALRLVETRTPAPDGMDTVSYTLYDVSGRVSQTSNPYLVADDAKAVAAATTAATTAVGDGAGNQTTRFWRAARTAKHPV